MDSRSRPLFTHPLPFETPGNAPYFQEGDQYNPPAILRIQTRQIIVPHGATKSPLGDLGAGDLGAGVLWRVLQIEIIFIQVKYQWKTVLVDTIKLKIRDPDIPSVKKIYKSHNADTCPGCKNKRIAFKISVVRDIGHMDTCSVQNI